MKRLLIFATLVFTIPFVATAQKRQNKFPIPNNGPGGEQITEVTLERTACFGTCPAYKITLRRDGTATYVGMEYVERKGTYNGKFYGFERLAQFIEARGFFDLKDNYSINATDLPSAITTVVRAGQRKTVINYGDVGPLELWGVEKVIDGVMANTKWQKVSDK